MVPDRSKSLLTQSLHSLIQAIGFLIKAILEALPKEPSAPASLGLIITRETVTKSMKTFAAAAKLPPIPPNEGIVTQILTVSADGGAPVDAGATLADAGKDFFFGFYAENTKLIVTLGYVDDAGNKSAVTTAELTVTDTFPPNAPLAFTLTETAEVDTPDPA